MLKGGLPVHVVFEVDAQTDEELRDTVYESRESSLYKRARVMIEAEKEKKRLKAEAGGVATTSSTNDESNGRRNNSRFKGEGYLQKKSEELALRLRNYQTDPKVERMRTQRATLPVASHASSVLAKIANSSVVVVLAATGSGKTTQVPQLVLDDWILRGEGAKCNIVCTQPRRIAAISVAQRVAAERGEKVGESVGYQVRSIAAYPFLFRLLICPDERRRSDSNRNHQNRMDRSSSARPVSSFDDCKLILDGRATMDSWME